MSRGVKDLRELVVVSRLTYRESDSESDDGRAGMITPFESLTLDIGSTGSSALCAESQDRTSSTPPSSADSSGRKKRRKKKKTSRPNGYITHSTDSVLLRNRPLPPVGVIENGRPSAGSNESSTPSAETRDFDKVLTHIDTNVVADWLQRANASLHELACWCTDTNFVNFAQFWITEFGVDKRCEILALEHSILLDELMLAFSSAKRQNLVSSSEISQLLSALFREYPSKLTMSAGVYIFLDYLDIFTSERTMEYRAILSDVKLSSRNKEHIQCILATRCFILINVWVAIVNFFRKLTEGHDLKCLSPPVGHRDKVDVMTCRLLEAIRLGNVEVVHYYLYSGKVSAGFVDSNKKTLLLTAVAANQARVVEYLLRKWTGCMDVNRPCDTGNSPLHVAVNLGNTTIVKILLQAADLNLNVSNANCDGATPLHLAVLHGHTDIVQLLLQKGADVHLNMGNMTVTEVAEDFGHKAIVNLLKSYLAS